MTINRDFFFDRVRSDPFGGGLGQHQVAGCEAILAAWEKNHAAGDGRRLAYMLATAFHETAHRMQPVRETLARSDDEAIARLDRAWAKGQLSSVKTPYWRKDESGRAWYGRGLVQLTHKANYVRMAAAIGHPGLATDPSQALDMDVSIKILFAGMERGLFTGRKLGDYFNPTTEDWVNARRIINGLDRAGMIAGYGKAFHAAISDTT